MQRKLENWLKTYIQYTAYNEAPDIFHFWAGVGAISSVLRRRVWFDQEYFQWTPNFYIIFVAPPGISTKSTAMGISSGLVKEVSGIKFGPNAITWQALATAMSNATEMVLMPDQMFHSMSCLSFYTSEFGTLLDPQDRKMVDILVDLWDGQLGTWEKETKTSGCDKVVNPWITIVACTTPSWLADNIPQSMIYGGFTSRCVFVYSDCKRQLIPYPRNIMPKEAKDLKALLIHDLQLMASMAGEFIMTPEAEEMGIAWYLEHHKTQAKLLQQDQGMSGYFARKQGHIHKLAMVISASQRDDLLITKEDFETALRILTAVEKDLPKVFKALRTGHEMEHLQRIIDCVLEKGSIKKEELYRQYLHVMPERAFNELLGSAVGAGVLRLVQRSTTIWVEPGDKVSDTPRSTEHPVSIVEDHSQ